MVDVIGKCRKHEHAPARGFSIVELMVTIAVAAVLLGLALPSFRSTIMSSNVTQTTNQLIGDLNLARSEAVRRGTLVAVISNSGGNNWSTGWYVKTDGDFVADGTFTTANDVVLHENTGVNTAGSYKVTTAVATAAGTGIAPSVGLIIFNAQGNLIPRAQKFSINVCRPDSQPTLSKLITIATSGIVTSQINTSSSPAPGC